MKMVPLACFPKDFDYNVRLVMIVTFLNICAQTIWQGGIMVLFVFMITHKSNEAVGFLAGLGGIVQLLSAPIVATSADSYSRPTILQYGSLVGLAGFMVATIAIIYANYAFLCAAMIILGIYNSIVNPTLDAVVADSIQQGGRSRVYTWKFVIQLMGKAVGPSVALVMFFAIGNEWTISSCQIVMLIGVTLYLIPLMLLRQFHTQDIRSGNSRLGIKEGLGIKPGYHPVETSDEEKCSSESLTDLETKGDIELGGVIMEDALTTVENDASGEKPLLLTDNRRDCGCNDDVVEKEGTLLTDDSAQMAQWRLCLCCCSQKEPFSIPLVPAMIVLSDFMAALASGMSIRFFPVFFMENMHLLPVELSCIDVVSPSIIAHIYVCTLAICGRIIVFIRIDCWFVHCCGSIYSAKGQQVLRKNLCCYIGQTRRIKLFC